MALTDTCIFLESTAGDGGVHTNPTWWLSPDVQIIAPDGTGRATPGPNATTPTNNTLQVRVHKKSGCTVDGDTVLVDVYVGDPSLTMTPTSGVTKLTNAAGRPSAFISPATLTAAGTTTNITWALPLVASGPESPGHKCLIARCYPDSNTPPGATFDLPTDQHVVQRNICIIPCSECGQEVQTTNLNLETEQKVTIRAVADLKPSKAVLAVLRPLLKAAPGFKRINTKEPVRFRLEFDKRQKLEVATRDNTGAPTKLGNFGRLKVPNFEAKLVLRPGQTIKFRFSTDLSDERQGDAFVFHLMHISAKGQVLGGLTVVAVHTDDHRAWVLKPGKPAKGKR